GRPGCSGPPGAQRCVPPPGHRRRARVRHQPRGPTTPSPRRHRSRRGRRCSSRLAAVSTSGGTVAVLWDIDGTLLTTARAGIRAWEDAVTQVTGIEVELAEFPTAGLTDRAIARDLLRLAGLEPDDHVVFRLLSAYTARLPDRLPERVGRVMSNVVEILHALCRRGDAVVGLVTGNAREGARA